MPANVFKMWVAYTREAVIRSMLTLKELQRAMAQLEEKILNVNNRDVACMEELGEENHFQRNAMYGVAKKLFICSMLQKVSF